MRPLSQNVFLARLVLALCLFQTAMAVGRAAQNSSAISKPNIIFILADDLGYGDLGCYGQMRIRTPNLDRMATEGLRFTSCYAGSTVCAPSRSALMTGQHTGRTRIRGNARKPLLPEDVTVAEVLKQAGYRTGLIGKWGLGEQGSSGSPIRQGFDYSFGYLNQAHAHNYYTSHLWRNDEKVLLSNVVTNENAEGAGVASRKVEYTHDLFTAEAEQFISSNSGGPFFLYLACTIPHANNEARAKGMEVPSNEPYGAEDWPEAQKNMAAMVTRMDRDIGKLLALLKRLEIDERTIVFFASDNGPHKEGGNNPDFFQSSGNLRGIKRAMYEGGIRVPMIVRWPGTVKAGGASDYAWAFWDFLPTAAEIAGASVPSGIDGISVLPVLLGKRGPNHPPFYWEFHEGGFKQAARMGKWKGVKLGRRLPLELYDLENDLEEAQDVSEKHPKIVREMERYLMETRNFSPDWPMK